MLWKIPSRVNRPISAGHGRALASCKDSDRPDVVGWQTVFSAEEYPTFKDVYRHICTVSILVLKRED